MSPPSFIPKLFYAILLSPLQSKESAFVGSQSQPVFYQTKSTYKRTISTVNLVDNVIPGAANRLSRLMYRNNRFPWAPIDINLIAFGTGCAVFKLGWKNCNKVLRIYRKSLGKSLPGILEIARHYKKNYEIVLSWYGGSLDLVLPMDFMVLYGLPFASPVAASLQPYIQGQKLDPFEDFSEDELSAFLQTHDHVRQQFLFFAQQTLRQWNEQKMCLDLLGRENLMLINDEGGYRLCIVDVGLFNLNVIVDLFPEKLIKIEHRMERLASLLTKKF